MSDEEDFIMQDDDDDEFDFEYDDEDDIVDLDDDISEKDSFDKTIKSETNSSSVESHYYLTKEKRDIDPASAIVEFTSIVNNGHTNSTWKFRAAKQIVKVAFAIGDLDCVLDKYRIVLQLFGAVSKAHGERSIGNLVERFSKSTNAPFLESIYRETLAVLDSETNERLWIKVELKLAELLLSEKNLSALYGVLEQLQSKLDTVGSTDQSKNAILLQVYAIRIQESMYLNDIDAMRVIFAQASKITSALVHPRITGTIKECGGKIYATDKNWDRAQSEFFEAFKNYDEAGSARRLACLQYLVLLSMIGNSTINPFDSQETKPYATHVEIKPLMNLYAAFQKHNLHSVKDILDGTYMKQLASNDAFLEQSLGHLLLALRTKIVLALLRYYTTVDLEFLSDQLSISVSGCEQLLSQLILAEKLNGQIDKLSNRFELRKEEGPQPLQLAEAKWIAATEKILASVKSQIRSF